ncbi:hypothetical protein ACW9HQ_52165, partial [Nocardia gipuzkoensis]
MRMLGIAATLAATILAAGCSSNSGDSSTHVKDCGSQRQTRPASITITCADANHSISDISWSSWTGDSARGSGTEHRNRCEPSCAA